MYYPRSDKVMDAAGRCNRLVFTAWTKKICDDDGVVASTRGACGFPDCAVLLLHRVGNRRRESVRLSLRERIACRAVAGRRREVRAGCQGVLVLSSADDMIAVAVRAAVNTALFQKLIPPTRSSRQRDDRCGST